MKAYVGLKKIIKDDNFKYGLTLYNSKGSVVYSVVRNTHVKENKFDNAIEGFNWVVRHLSNLFYNGTIPEDEKIELFMDNKVLYQWIENEKAPYPYTIPLADLLLEMAFLQNETEIIYSKNCKSRVTWQNSEEEKLVSVKDLLNNMAQSETEPQPKETVEVQ